ncbi:MAG: SRPBCC family protein [Chitinophagales bacterium]|nr:SRPBCC family protein [Hyphomicrobiales bacterium]
MRLVLASALILASASFVPSTAFAVEVKQRVEIEGEMTKVWEKVGGWCAISTWHPAVAKCDEAKDGDKTKRTLTLKDGAVVKETMTKTGKNSYSYVIDESPFPVANYSATFSAVPDDDDKNEINILWFAKFDAKGVKDDEAAKIMKGVLKGGLDNIKKMYK